MHATRILILVAAGLVAASPIALSSSNPSAALELESRGSTCSCSAGGVTVQCNNGKCTQTVGGKTTAIGGSQCNCGGGNAASGAGGGQSSTSTSSSGDAGADPFADDPFFADAGFKN